MDNENKQAGAQCKSRDFPVGNPPLRAVTGHFWEKLLLGMKNGNFQENHGKRNRKCREKENLGRFDDFPPQFTFVFYCQPEKS